MNPADYPVVAIRWADSHSPDGVWTDVTALAEGWAYRLECLSFGFLIHENERCVVIAASVSTAEHPQAQGAISIPRSSIISMKVQGNPFSEPSTSTEAERREAHWGRDRVADRDADGS